MRDNARNIKTADYVYNHRGFWDEEPHARCRVRFIDRGDAPPILLLSEPPDNESTSVTNMIEVLAAELIAKHCPARFESTDTPPVIVIEHYPPEPTRPHGRRKAGSYDLVSFARWTPRPARSGAQNRIALTQPFWKRLRPDEVRALLGDEADDLTEE
jgi:hypothetical protein